MILDGHQFIRLPGEVTPIDAVKYAASILTYAGVQYFSWGAEIVGKPIILSWEGLSTAEFNIFKTKYEANLQVVWNPELGDARTFNVEIVRLNSAYHMSLLTSASERLRVEMELLIMSQV